MDWYLDRGVRTAVTELRREIKAQLVRHADAWRDDLELWIDRFPDQANFLR